MRDITNRKLQLETREIPIDHQVKIDDVNLTMDKMVINSNSQKIYFYIDGVKDFDYNNTSGMDDHRYEFGLSGTDDKGNEVRAEVKEIIDGYGYFELMSWDDDIALNKDVTYYDLRITYTWHDPKGDVVHDGNGIGAEESVYYGVRIGATSATLTGDADVDSKVGMTLGGVIGLRLSSSTPVFLESGLYYTERGAKNIGYNNLEVPLLIKYGIQATDDIAVLPYIGPYFSFGIAGKIKTPTLGEDGTTVKTSSVSSYKHAFNHADMGFKIGCGAEYNKLYAEIGYQLGVANISKVDDVDGHGHAFYINLGVNF